MEEIDIAICLKKINKDLKNIKKNYCKAKNKHKKVFIFFPLHGIKWNKKSQILAKNVLLKIYFMNTNNQLILITQTLKKQYCLVKNQIVIQVHFNTLLDIKVILILYHYT